MGKVIKFPQGRRSRETPARTADAAAVIILPVVRIERGRDTPIKDKVIKPAAKSPPVRKRRKREAAGPASALPSPACG
jgi:hypothetical protein